jgi:HEAT repeat protein
MQLDRFVSVSDPLTDQRRIYQAIRAKDVDVLIDALRDPENRAWAARHLGKFGDPSAIGPLIRLLTVRDFHTRAAAARALGQLRAREAVPSLIASADEGPEDVMRAWSIDSLGKIGSVEAVPTLIETLASEHKGLRRTAAVALGEIGDPCALPALEESATHESWLAGRHYRRIARRLRRASASRAAA